MALSARRTSSQPVLMLNNNSLATPTPTTSTSSKKTPLASLVATLASHDATQPLSESSTARRKSTKSSIKLVNAGASPPSSAPRVQFMLFGEPDGGAGLLLAHLLGSDYILSRPDKLHRVVSVDGQDYSLELFTNLGFGRLRGVADGAARAVQAFIFVFDVTKRHTYLSFETWREWLAQIRPDLETVPLLLLGLCPSQINALDASSSGSSNSNGGILLGQSLGVTDQVALAGASLRTSSEINVDSLPSTPNSQSSLVLAPVRSVDSEEARQLAEAYGCRYREVILPAFYSPSTPHSHEDPVLDPFLGLIRSIQKDGRSALVSGDPSGLYGGAEGKAMDLTLVGDSFVGKSAILERLTSSRFISRYVSTTEPRLVKHKAGVDGTLYLLRIRDTCGWAGEEGLSRDQLMLTHGVLLVFDLTNARSLEALRIYHDYISSVKHDKKVAYILVGCKRDLADSSSGSLLSRAVSLEHAKSLAKQWNCPYIEFSAKEDDPTNLLRAAVRQVRYVFDESSSSALPTSISGYMNLKGPAASNFSRKYVRFVEGRVCWWKDEASASEPSKPKHCLEIGPDTEVSIPLYDPSDPLSKWGHLVTVKASKRTVMLATTSAAERDAWVAALLSSVAIHRISNGILDEFVREALKEMRALLSEPDTKATHSSPSTGRSSKRKSTRPKE